MYLFEVKKPAESKYPWRLLSSARDHPGGRSVPSAQGRQLPAGEQLSADIDRARPRRSGARPRRLPGCGVAKSGCVRSRVHSGNRSGVCIPRRRCSASLLIGLINGSFYALLSLGLAVIFGMLNIINFTHGAQYMMGAFVAFLLLQYSGLNYWLALIIAPIVGRRDRHRDRAAVPAVALQARSSLRPAADLRPRADHRGPVPQLVRLVRPALSDAGGADRRPEPRLHVPAELPRLGDRGLARRSVSPPGS